MGNTKSVSNGVSITGISDGVNAETKEEAGDENTPTPGPIADEAKVPCLKGHNFRDHHNNDNESCVTSGRSVGDHPILEVFGLSVFAACLSSEGGDLPSASVDHCLHAERYECADKVPCNKDVRIKVVTSNIVCAGKPLLDCMTSEHVKETRNSDLSKKQVPLSKK